MLVCKIPILNPVFICRWISKYEKYEKDYKLYAEKASEASRPLQRKSKFIAKAFVNAVAQECQASAYPYYPFV